MKTLFSTLFICLLSCSLFADNQLKRFEKLWEITDLGTKAQAAGPITIVIPTDEAFVEMNSYAPKLLKDLDKPANRELLLRILSYHILVGKHDLNHIQKEMMVPTLEGEEVMLRDRQGITAINDASVIEVDKIAQLSGLGDVKVFVIDRVLIPPPKD